MLLLFFFKFLQILIYWAFDWSNGDELRRNVFRTGTFVNYRDAFHFPVLLLDNYIDEPDIIVWDFY